MFKKILVANRGDVALRIMRACRELGVKSVAVYSDADRKALHVRYADEAYLVGEGPARSSYLNLGRIIDVAIRSRADAVHPGYGFFAENPRLSQACMEAEIGFIGPDAEMIRRLGDRLHVREELQRAGFPVVPMSAVGLDEADFREAARRLGFPLVVKPVAGSGGRGERLVGAEDELAELLAAARREAELAFGEGAVYLERALSGVRRIEVQLLADSFGQVICLGESEGTIQRRHQKLVEEAPSPAVHPELRVRMQSTAIAITRQVGYVGAATMEFVLDASGQYYFMHMSPRLHVEHPVIEMVAGLDLVKEQIRIASGRKLRHGQDAVRLSGCALECRIHAEDPYDGFKPAIGRISRLSEPSGPGVRVDSGVGEGSEISHYYDSLISKVVAWGETRGEAILRMRRALDEYRIVGVKTNIPFLQQILNRTSFIGGQFDASQEDQYFAMMESNRDELREISAVAAVLLTHQSRTRRPAGEPRTKPSAWKVAGRWEEMSD
jgi:acetyl-CoA carboxylase, biotin carboxylase subunit